MFSSIVRRVKPPQENMSKSQNVSASRKEIER